MVLSSLHLNAVMAHGTQTWAHQPTGADGVTPSLKVSPFYLGNFPNGCLMCVPHPVSIAATKLRCWCRWLFDVSIISRSFHGCRPLGNGGRISCPESQKVPKKQFWLQVLIIPAVHGQTQTKGHGSNSVSQPLLMTYNVPGTFVQSGRQ